MFLSQLNETLSSFDKDDCGDYFELYITTGLCETNGFGYTGATPDENRLYHFDWHIQGRNDRQPWTIDTKAPKKLKMRPDEPFTKDYFLLEYTGWKGFPGWLRGKADKLGMYMIDDDACNLYVFDREECLMYARSLGMDPEQPHRYSGRPPIKQWLQRWGEKTRDSFIWVPKQELLDSLYHYDIFNVPVSLMEAELRKFQPHLFDPRPSGTI